MVLFSKVKSLLMAGLVLLCLPLQVVALNVVVTIQPIHSLVAGIMAGVDTPHRLLHPGMSPHFFSLKPSDRKLLSEADFVVWVGPDLEQVMTPIMAQRPAEKQLTLLNEKSIHILPYRTQAHDHHEHDHDHEHDHHHLLDPHVWLSPDEAIHIVALVTAKLSALDPRHAEQYQTNAAHLTEKLHQLKKELKVQLAGNEDQHYLVYHDAYQYFEKAFGLAPPVVVNMNPHLPLSVKRIRMLQQVIEEKQIQCVFTEPEFSEKFLNALSKANIQHYQLDPLGANQPEAGEAVYFNLMRNIAEQFQTCFQHTSSRKRTQ